MRKTLSLALVLAMVLTLLPAAVVAPTEAANVMRKYFDSPDTTIPDHIRTIYRSFELDSMQTETALETVLNDVMQPRFKKFRTSFYTKILRLIGYKGLMTDVEKDEHYQKIKHLIDGMADGFAPDFCRRFGLRL